MLIESGMGCCCPKEDVLFWKNRHIDAMKQLIQVRQENLELKKQLAGAKAQCENTVENRLKISELSREVVNLREQQRVDQAVKKELDEKNETLHKALDIAAKDADANFERGKIKGMTEIWKELVDCYDGRPIGENNKIFGYHTVGDMLMNLSPTWFMNKAREYHERKENEEAHDIQIGDEVEIFDTFCPDDNPHSDFGIVVIIGSENNSYVVVGPNFEGCFDETDIQSGTVKKTGNHYDAIPTDYFA